MAPATGDATFADVIRAIVRIREETPDMAWMLDIPVVGGLLIKRAAGQIDDQMFRYQLYRTGWWRQHSDAQRQWQTQVSIDPAQAQRQRRQMALRVQQLIGELGVNLKGSKPTARGERPRQGGYQLVGAGAAARIADLALYNGWDEAQITNYLLSLTTWGQEGQNATGGIAVAMNEIRRLEEQYGVTRADRNRFRQARAILNGRQTIEGMEELLRQQALTRYGSNATLRGVLERGGTLADFFDPYRQMLAQELEIPEAQISMTDPKWEQLLMVTDPSTKEVRPMTFVEARRFARSQPGWSETAGAQEQSAGLALALGRMFGAIA